MNHTNSTNAQPIAGAIALASIKAILQAMTLAAAGFYLGRKGVMTKEGAKLISAISARVAIPTLYFTRVLPSVDLQLVGAVWPMLFMPLIICSIGSLLGWLTVLICKPKPAFRKGMIAAVAIGNATSMPIVLLSVIDEQASYLFGPATGPDGKSHVVDPIVYMGVYSLTWPIVQWIFGGLLLIPKGDDAQGGEAQGGSASGDERAPAAASSADALECADPGRAPEATPRREDESRPLNLEGGIEGEVPDVDGFARTSYLPSIGGRAHTLWERSSESSVRLRVRSTPSGATEMGIDTTDASDRADDGALVADGRKWRRLSAVADFFLERVLVPPVIGVLLGMVCSTIPPTYYLLCGGTFGSRLPAAQCPAHNATLGFLTRGIATLGASAVPLNLILLGNAMSKGPDWEALDLRCNAGIVVSKMILMPAMGVLLCLFLDTALGDEGVGWLALSDPYDQVLYIAIAALTATPSSNTLILMIELAGGDKAAMSTAIFSQYVAAPLVLTVSLTLSILVLHSTG
jgi:predicted permease